MEKGKIKFYNEEKGFGFIIPEKGGDDIFFHVSGLSEGTAEALLKENEDVEYNIKNGKRGLNATDIELQNRVKNYS